MKKPTATASSPTGSLYQRLHALLPSRKCAATRAATIGSALYLVAHAMPQANPAIAYERGVPRRNAATIAIKARTIKNVSAASVTPLWLSRTWLNEKVTKLAAITPTQRPREPAHSFVARM